MRRAMHAGASAVTGRSTQNPRTSVVVFCVICVFCVFGVCTPPTLAQAPTPAAVDDEPLQPDRPDVTNGTHIVDVGLVQVEIGGLYTHPAAEQHAIGSPFTARVGLADWAEARIGTDGLLTSIDHGTAQLGFGNLQLGAKLRLWADPGGMPVLSILPAVDVPTATNGLGSGDADYLLAVLTGTDLGVSGHIDVNYGIGSIGAGSGLPHFTQHLASASASYALTSKWNPYAELFWFSRVDPSGGASASFDVGAIYTVSPRLAIDGGVQGGLSRAAPAFAAFGGVSVVVGNILGDHGVHARQRRAQTRAAHAGKK